MSEPWVELVKKLEPILKDKGVIQIIKESVTADNASGNALSSASANANAHAKKSTNDLLAEIVHMDVFKKVKKDKDVVNAENLIETELKKEEKKEKKQGFFSLSKSKKTLSTQNNNPQQPAKILSMTHWDKYKEFSTSSSKVKQFIKDEKKKTPIR